MTAAERDSLAQAQGLRASNTLAPALDITDPPLAEARPQCPMFTTLGMPLSDIQTAAAKHEAEYRDALFQPRINCTPLAEAQREMPVEEILLGKGQYAKRQIEYKRAMRAAEERRMCERSVPTPRCTEELARRHAMRTGQSATERLRAPRKSTGRAQTGQPLGNEHGGGAPACADDTRQARSARVGGGRGKGGAVDVAERSAGWQRLKEWRRQQLAQSQAMKEAASCPFQPMGLGSSRLRPAASPRVDEVACDERAKHASSAGALAVYERTTAWQAQREDRLAIARREAVRRATQPSSMVIYAPVGDNDEPRFMAPTASASERWQSSVTISDSLVPDASQLPPPPPEWAAPIR